VNTALGQQGVTAGPVDTVVVACCQLTPTLGGPGAIRERVADAVCHAVSLGARIVVLPELVSSGCVFEDRAEAAASAEPTDGETLTLWARLAADHQIVIVGGFCEQAASGEVFNSLRTAASFPPRRGACTCNSSSTANNLPAAAGCCGTATGSSKIRAIANAPAAKPGRPCGPINVSSSVTAVTHDVTSSAVSELCTAAESFDATLALRSR
jgi:Carbon-nitrogen hydrolase